MIARTPPGLDLSDLDQDLDLAEDRADHGLMAEERSKMNPEALSQGYKLLFDGFQACWAATLAAVGRGGAGMVRTA